MSTRITSWLRTLRRSLTLDGARLGTVVRLSDHARSCMIMRADDEIFVVQYVFGRFGNSPIEHLRASEGGLFEVYAEHFESVWGVSRPCPASED